ncbi:hypothetical protein AHAS_Ahas17G0322000 [Arachis hypogaea]
MDSATPTHTHSSKSQPPFAVAEKVLAKHKGRFYEAKVNQLTHTLTLTLFSSTLSNKLRCLSSFKRLGRSNSKRASGAVLFIIWVGRKGGDFLSSYSRYQHQLRARFSQRFCVFVFIIKCSWDEWLATDCLMKDTEENMQIKLAIDEKFGHDKSTKIHRASFNKPKTPNNESRGRKRKSETPIKEKPEVPPDKLVSIQIPPTLRKQLVDDCEFITHLGKLVKLPRTPNVNDIMKNYFDYRLKKCGSISDSVEEILKGLCCYFDKALPVKLLYKNERQQYQEACPDNTTPSTVYGAEHLLRLFVKLPELLSHASIEEESMTELQAQLVDILRFLQRNQSTYFLSTYHVPDDIENSTNKQGD